MQVAVISPGIYTYGAMLIGGVARDAGHNVKLRKTLKARPKETVLLSLFSTHQLLDPEIQTFVQERRQTGNAVYVGGPVSAVPDIVLGELDVDAVCIGEGETILPLLLKKGPCNAVPGIAYRNTDGTITRTAPAPLPSVHHPPPVIPPEIATQDVRGANAYIETHRGCAGACTFCQVPRFFGRDVRSREIPEILKEVREFKKHGAKRLSISGGTGSYFQYHDGHFNEDAFAELLKGMAKIMGPKNISSPDIRVDAISDTILDAIHDYTIGWVFFGLESGSDDMLRTMGKGATVADADRAIETCRDHGLNVAGSFIVGYPNETEADYEATKERIASWGLDDVFISIAEPIPGTPLATLSLKTPVEENPVFTPHTGEYHALHLSEAEARSFDLQLHADMFKPNLHVVSDQLFSAYLAGVREDGAKVRTVTELLKKYQYFILH